MSLNQNDYAIEDFPTEPITEINSGTLRENLIASCSNSDEQCDVIVVSAKTSVRIYSK